MPVWKLHTEFKLDGSHFVENYDGKSRRVYGHSYKGTSRRIPDGIKLKVTVWEPKRTG